VLASAGFLIEQAVENQRLRVMRKRRFFIFGRIGAADTMNGNL
jgi:hypothetical protein